MRGVHSALYGWRKAAVQTGPLDPAKPVSMESLDFILLLKVARKHIVFQEDVVRLDLRPDHVR